VDVANGPVSGRHAHAVRFERAQEINRRPGLKVVRQPAVIVAWMQDHRHAVAVDVIFTVTPKDIAPAALPILILPCASISLNIFSLARAALCRPGLFLRHRLEQIPYLKPVLIFIRLAGARNPTIDGFSAKVFELTRSLIG
jgi:hypothetical protein